MTDFKTPEEVQAACERLKPWPLSGYAPGGYMCACSRCETLFEGDKRAVECLECAASAVNAALTQSQARIAELEGALRPFAEVPFDEHRDMHPWCWFQAARALLNSDGESK